MRALGCRSFWVKLVPVSLRDDVSVVREQHRRFSPGSVRQPEGRGIHVFIQGGCGGLAAAVCVDLWCRYGDRMPRLVIVEPVSAACLHDSALHGMLSRVDITTESVMAGLSCGEVSLIAWPIIAAGASDFLAITDDPIAPLMRRLAHEESIVAGESAVAGLAGLTEARKDDLLWTRLGLSRESRVLLFGTEGATDPDIYRAMVGGGAS